MRYVATLLLVVTAACQALLWISYAIMRPTSKDFGNVPTNLHAYLIVTFGLAHVANLAFVTRLALYPEASDDVLRVATGMVVLYYGMQLAFLPLVRAATEHGYSKRYVRILLVACVAPMVVLAAMGLQTRDSFLGITGVFPAAHVLLDDALLYGLLF